MFMKFGGVHATNMSYIMSSKIMHSMIAMP